MMDMITLEDQKDLLEDIREGVEIAVYERGEDADSVDSIKLNKLTYFAISAFEMDEITFGWYKYGAAPRPSEPNGMWGPDIVISPQPATSIQAVDNSRIPTVHKKYRSPREYAWFFERQLEDFDKILKTENTKEYLLDFYEDEAPPEYRELYIQSAHLQILIDEIRAGSEWHNRSEQMYYDVSHRLNNIYGQLLQAPELRKSMGAFQGYNRFFQDVLATADSHAELTDEQQQFINKCVRFFYENTWEYVASLISRDTVTGDLTVQLTEDIDRNLDRLDERYERELDQLKERAKSFNLRPENSIVEGDTSSREEPEQNLDHIDAWTRVSSEIINQ